MGRVEFKVRLIRRRGFHPIGAFFGLLRERAREIETDFVVCSVKIFWGVLAVLYFLCFSPVSKAENTVATDIFLWGGEQLADLNGPNADRIRALYQPIMSAYPNISACAEAIPNASKDGKLTSGDLRALPNLETAEVCLFYSLTKLTTQDEVIASMVGLGFSEVDRIPTRYGFHINMFLNTNDGPISYGSWLRRLSYRGFLLVIKLDSSVGVTSVRLKPISRIQL